MSGIDGLILAALAAAACAADQEGAEPCPPGTATAQAANWRGKATDRDRERIRSWRTAWVEALAEARAVGQGDALAAERPLLDPDAAIAFADIPPGEYRCRTIKIGTGSDSEGLAYVAYPAFTCRIAAEDDSLRFTKVTGSQRPIGYLYPDEGDRRIFLGTLQLGDEQRAFRYGRDRHRDMAGILDRIGDRRWRLVLPYPAFESTIDIIELTPATE